ncbi:NIPSNAP family protein [Pararhodobacter marinus]|uniref:NIPSNAP family protein n=1 Tax=Pararhodobacter marinus TaxID=2184063 RepID=A0A2U2C718_9RHOB|nr:NIPSNAP family protein [Pararhodobacter marinus]PWE27641.1 NIPSNAP family protein [Pararhodobacter marinus]
MIVEQRTYRFRPGMIPQFMALYQAGPLALQRRVLGNLIGYFVTELGPLNETVHLWGYDGLDDRARRRAALMAEPEWRRFLTEILPLLETQESKILLPTDFSPFG